MSDLVVRRVESKRDLKKFVMVPFAVHRDHPEWVPPLIMDRMAFLNRNKNPYFDHAEVELWIAERDGVPVGREIPISEVPDPWAPVLPAASDTGSIIVANTPEQFAAQIKAEFDVYKKVVDQQKLRLD